MQSSTAQARMARRNPLQNNGTLIITGGPLARLPTPRTREAYQKRADCWAQEAHPRFLQNPRGRGRPHRQMQRRLGWQGEAARSATSPGDAPFGAAVRGRTQREARPWLQKQGRRTRLRRSQTSHLEEIRFVAAHAAVAANPSTTLRAPRDRTPEKRGRCVREGDTEAGCARTADSPQDRHRDTLQQRYCSSVDWAAHARVASRRERQGGPRERRAPRGLRRLPQGRRLLPWGHRCSSCRPGVA